MRTRTLSASRNMFPPLTRSSDRYDKAYRDAALMHVAGVKVAICSGETENARFVATYGLRQEEALWAVTIVPAEILGVADQRDSLKVGKEATLFVADGDPFETKTQIHHSLYSRLRDPNGESTIRGYMMSSSIATPAFKNTAATDISVARGFGATAADIVGSIVPADPVMSSGGMPGVSCPARAAWRLPSARPFPPSLRLASCDPPVDPPRR